MIRPDGETVEHEYAPAYPPQFPDVSYGLSDLGGQTVSLIGPGAPAAYLVPSSDSDDVNNPRKWAFQMFNAYIGNPFDQFAIESLFIQASFTSYYKISPFNLFLEIN